MAGHTHKRESGVANRESKDRQIVRVVGVACRGCGGSGEAPASSAVVRVECPRCGGTGRADVRLALRRIAALIDRELAHA